MPHRLVLAVLLLALGCGSVNAHELPFASASVLLREGGHIQLQGQLAVLEGMHAWHGQGLSLTGYLQRCLSMDASEWERELAGFGQWLAEGVQLRADGQRNQRFQRWRLPRPEEMQQAARLAIMQLTVDPTHPHLERQAVSAELLLTAPAKQVQIAFPAELGPVQIAFSRPRQHLLTAGQLSPPYATTEAGAVR